MKIFNLTRRGYFTMIAFVSLKFHSPVSSNAFRISFDLNVEGGEKLSLVSNLADNLEYLHGKDRKRRKKMVRV